MSACQRDLKLLVISFCGGISRFSECLEGISEQWKGSIGRKIIQLLYPAKSNQKSSQLSYACHLTDGTGKIFIGI